MLRAAARMCWRKAQQPPDELPVHAFLVHKGCNHSVRIHVAARAACKDVGRVMGVPLGEIDKLTKLIPGVPGMTLDKALRQSPDLEKLYNENR